MKIQFKRRVQFILDSLQDTEKRSKISESGVIKEYESELKNQLEKYFDTHSDVLEKHRYDQEKAITVQKNEYRKYYTSHIELCDEFDLKLPMGSDFIENSLQIEENMNPIDVKTLLLSIPKQYHSEWKSNSTNSQFIMSQVRFWIFKDTWTAKQVLRYSKSINPTDTDFLNLLYALILCKESDWLISSKLLKELLESKDAFIQNESKILFVIAQFKLGHFENAISMSSDFQGVYVNQIKAIVQYQKDQVIECIQTCKKTILLMNQLNRLRIDPFLLLSRCYCQQFDFEKAENLLIECNQIFDTNASHLEYAKFLDQFKNRNLDVVKQLSFVDLVERWTVEDINRLLHCSIEHDLLEMLKIVLKRNTEVLIHSFGYHFEMNAISLLEIKLARNPIKYPTSRSLLEIGIVFGLCARYMGLYTKSKHGAMTCYFYCFLIEKECLKNANFRDLSQMRRVLHENRLDVGLFSEEFKEYLNVIREDQILQEFILLENKETLVRM